MTLPHPGDRFPALNVPLTGGGTPALPDALAGGFGVVLFYRGAWCPYCNAQLRAFQRASESLAEVGAKVVALSVDDEATAQELVTKHGLTFPVGHSADARAVAAATGAFVNDEPRLSTATRVKSVGRCGSIRSHSASVSTRDLDMSAQSAIVTRIFGRHARGRSAVADFIQNPELEAVSPNALKPAVRRARCGRLPALHRLEHSSFGIRSPG